MQFFKESWTDWSEVYVGLKRNCVFCLCGRFGWAVLIMPLVTTRSTARRRCTQTISTPNSVLGTLRQFGPGPVTWAFCGARSWPMRVEVSSTPVAFICLTTGRITVSRLYPHVSLRTSFEFVSGVLIVSVCLRAPRRPVCGGLSWWNVGAEGDEVSPHRHWNVSYSVSQEHRWMVRSDPFQVWLMNVNPDVYQLPRLLTAPCLLGPTSWWWWWSWRDQSKRL